MENLIFKLLKIPKKDKKSLGRVRLLDDSGYPGVILEFVDFQPPKEKKSAECLLTYRVIKSPKKYTNLDDSHQKKFDSLVKSIFRDLIKLLMSAEKMEKNEG